MKYINQFLKPLFAFALILGLASNAYAESTQTTADKALEENAAHQSLLDFLDDQIYGKVPVKGYHKKVHQNGKSCALCHGSSEPVTPADTSNCANCHGSPEDVAKLTQEMEPNPHNSPHWETELPCDSCHIEHGKSKSVCSDCHQFGFKTP
ncbi:cytochrome c3 family protein [Vibrio sp. JC009]|uniref:cytochrome c3 family protein n=1 Tax=Vibrio sp. JC009 TaxID=2912314 RepID=UPI0023B1FC10|nr:cytochrome c3 family protein [Vibrio sp. JC009]WED23993.1 cytochrome c3 family protein [Vibrio sp. JC009]